MPTSVAQPRKRTLPGLWALIGAVVAIVAVFNVAVFLAKIVGLVILFIVIGVIGDLLNDWLVRRG